MKFNSEGELVPKISRSEAQTKIQQNLLEYNSEIRAKNVVHKIADALAVVTIEYGVEALKPIQSKISPKMQAEIDQKIVGLRIGIEGGWITINRKQIAKNLQRIMDLFLEMQTE